MENSYPLITIVTSAYNSENTIVRAMDSVLNQTYKNIEYIVIDHGSIDDTGNILYSYGLKDSRIKVLKIDKNTGYIGKAINYGLDHATGEYICFLDADDSYDLDYIEKMYYAIAETKAMVVMSGYRIVLNGTDEILDDNQIFKYMILDSKGKYKSLYEKIIDDIRVRSCMDFWWNKLYSMKYLSENNFRFAEDKFLCADAWFNRAIFDQYPKIAIIPYTGYNWYHSPNSTSRDFYRKNMYVEILEYAELWMNSLERLYGKEFQSEKMCNILLCSQIKRVLSLGNDIEEILEELKGWITHKIFKRIVDYTHPQIEFLRNIELTLSMLENREEELRERENVHWLEEYFQLNRNNNVSKEEKFEKIFSMLFEEDNYVSVGTQALIDMIVE